MLFHQTSGPILCDGRTWQQSLQSVIKSAAIVLVLVLPNSSTLLWDRTCLFRPIAHMQSSVFWNSATREFHTMQKILDTFVLVILWWSIVICINKAFVKINLKHSPNDFFTYLGLKWRCLAPKNACVGSRLHLRKKMCVRESWKSCWSLTVQTQ